MLIRFSLSISTCPARVTPSHIPPLSARRLDNSTLVGSHDSFPLQQTDTMSHSFRYPADTLTQVGDERNRSFAARRVAQEHRGLDRSSQRTPVMVRHLPHRPYTQPLQSSWNGVRAPSTYIQSSPDDGAKDSTIVGLTSNAPGHSSAHPQRPHIETSLPAKWSSERILSAACSRPLPLPFLPNRQSLAGMPLLPEDYPQCSLNRPSKVSRLPQLSSLCIFWDTKLTRNLFSLSKNIYTRSSMEIILW